MVKDRCERVDERLRLGSVWQSDIEACTGMFSRCSEATPIANVRATQDDEEG